MKTAADRTEGDINVSKEREKWIRGLSASTREILERDSRHFIHQPLSTPCLNVAKRSYGCFIEDESGNRILDFHGNNVHQAGFGNSYIIDSVIDELRRLPFCSRRYANRTAVELAEKIAGLTGGKLSRVLYAPAATVSMSMAVKLARIATGRNTVISMWDSFHGATIDTISLGGESHFRNGIGSLLPGFEHVFPFSSYRPLFENMDNYDILCAEYIEYVIKRDGNTAALVMETVRNTDVMIPTARYMKRVRDICDEHGVILILDETAVGLGKTGRMFAFEHFGIEPDMLVLGKGLGGGIIPFSCLAVRDSLNCAHFTSIGHFTHEKSPAGARAALALIEVIERDHLLEHVMEMEYIVRRRLHDIKERFELAGDVRVIGLLFCIELVINRCTKEKAELEAEMIMYACLRRGLNFKISSGNVLTFSPPMIISESEINLAFDIIVDSLADVISS